MPYSKCNLWQLQWTLYGRVTSYLYAAKTKLHIPIEPEGKLCLK
jgi:hypothetical protein